MIPHKSFAYFIILKREFSSGYMQRKPTNPTKLKYFNYLLEKGLISGTKNGYRLINLRKGMRILYTYEFKILKRFDNICEMSNAILESLTYNKLKQQIHSAKSYLENKRGIQIRGKCLFSLKSQLLTGNANCRTSSRAIAKEFDISQKTANSILNKIEKSKLIVFDKSKKDSNKHIGKYVKGIFNKRLWLCERYAVDIVLFPKTSILWDYYNPPIL